MTPGQVPPVPPDAGRSYMGVNSLTNPWVVWLLGQEPALLAEDAAVLTRSRMGAPPVCPKSKGGFFTPPHRMRWRPGAWKCYLHEGEPVAVPIEPKMERAPRGDVLSRVDEALDFQYDKDAAGFVIKEFTLPKKRSTPVLIKRRVCSRCGKVTTDTFRCYYCHLYYCADCDALPIGRISVRARCGHKVGNAR